MDKKIKVYMGLPTMGDVVDSQVHMLREIEKIYQDKVELVYPDRCVRRIFHDFARNCIVEEFLSSDCDVLWFLDADITPHKSVLDLVVCHFDEWKVAGAVYPIFMTPPGEETPEVLITAYKKTETGNYTMDKVPTMGTGFVDGLTTGCLFIKKEVFSELKKPYFEFTYENETRLIKEGEDLGFIRKMGNLGYKFFTNYAFVCKHYKNVDLLDMNNYAMIYAKRAVNYHDSIVKDQVKSALALMYEKGYDRATKDLAQLTHEIQTPSKTLWLPK